MTISKKGSRVFTILLLLVFVVSEFAYFGEDVYASSSVSKTLLSKKVFYLEPAAEYASYPNSKSFTFRVDRRRTIEEAIDIETEGGYGKTRVRIILKNENGVVLQNDLIKPKVDEEAGGGEKYSGWFYPDTKNGYLNPGKYTVTIKCSGDEYDDVHIKFSIKGYTHFANKAKVKKTVSKRSGNWVKFGKVYNGLIMVKRFKASNPKVAAHPYVDEDGNLWVFCRKKGTSVVSVTLMNGKKYKCKVNVKAGDPNMMAYVTDYDTRENCFKVKIRNCGIKNIYVIKRGSKVEDKDYKSYDRYVSSTKTVKIKPGQTKTVSFYLSGPITWYDHRDFTLYSKIRYEGRTYEWHVWYNNSVYKRDNSSKPWHYTYWDSGEYEDWY